MQTKPEQIKRTNLATVAADVVLAILPLRLRLLLMALRIGSAVE